MSTPTRKPYLSDEDIKNIETGKFCSERPWEMNYQQGATDIRDKYEAHLAEKDALIQRVVDYWDKWQGKGCIEADMEFDDIVTDMNKAGFTPKTEL